MSYPDQYRPTRHLIFPEPLVTPIRHRCHLITNFLISAVISEPTKQSCHSRSIPLDKYPESAHFVLDCQLEIVCEQCTNGDLNFENSERIGCSSAWTWFYGPMTFSQVSSAERLHRLSVFFLVGEINQILRVNQNFSTVISYGNEKSITRIS